MDKLVNVTEFGTVQQHELGLELEDMRGKQDTQITTRLFPASNAEATGGGQIVRNYVINRYRPGNKYKHVRLNGTVTQYNAVQYDITFATEEQRAENVINTPDTAGIPSLGILEFGDGGPLATDPALTSHAAGVFGFITTRGKAIANVNAAVAAGDFLSSGGGAAGRLVTVAAEGGAHVQAVAQGVQAAAFGAGFRALVAEPATGFKANLTWIFVR
jgi:hypothetical protein